MKWIFGSIFVEALLLAINVWFGVTYGGALNWASAAFIAVMAGATLVTYSRMP